MQFCKTFKTHCVNTPVTIRIEAKQRMNWPFRSRLGYAP
jgi:hypothetical protein